MRDLFFCNGKQVFQILGTILKKYIYPVSAGTFWLTISRINVIIEIEELMFFKIYR